MVGGAETAEKLKTARNINGVAFDGQKNIDIEANNPIKVLVKESLDDIKAFGDYFATGGNSVTGKPIGIDEFGLRVLRVAGGYVGQELACRSRRFLRFHNNSVWGNWCEVFTNNSPPGWSDIIGKPSAFNPSDHSHTKNQISDFPTSMKNPNFLTVSLNGVSYGEYDGSESKDFNITPAAIGAAMVNHTHNYLPLIGGTLTDGVEYKNGDISVCDNVAMFTDDTVGAAGTLKIALPVGFTSTMLTIYISIYDYFGSNCSNSDIVLSGYNYITNQQWLSTTAYCSNTTLVSSIRLGYDGSKCCILIGTTSSKWSYPKVAVTKVVAGFHECPELRTGWNISIITSEVGITALRTLNINTGLSAQTAVKLKTARKIGNTSFDGSANITLAQIGASASNHDHNNTYLKKGGVTWNDLNGV